MTSKVRPSKVQDFYWICQLCCLSESRAILFLDNLLGIISWVTSARSHTCYQVATIVVQFLSRVRLFAAWIAAYQVSLFFIISQNLLKLMSIDSVMTFSHLILCCSLLLLPSIFPSIQGLFQWVSYLHQVAKKLQLQFQHQSLQWIFRVDFL